MPAEIEDILSFWIADANDNPQSHRQQSATWYQSDPLMDERMRERFGETLQQAEQGLLDSWQESARGALALVVLLDQFSRNLYRGTADAWKNDPKALAVATQCIDANMHRSLGVADRLLLNHPFLHAESKAAQERSIRQCRFLLEEVTNAAPKWIEEVQHSLDYAESHAASVIRFGRFPHRNRALGRTSTPEEQAFLDADSRSYGQ